jgi:hypothetical protein
MWVMRRDASIEKRKPSGTCAAQPSSTLAFGMR